MIAAGKVLAPNYKPESRADWITRETKEFGDKVENVKDAIGLKDEIKNLRAEARELRLEAKTASKADAPDLLDEAKKLEQDAKEIEARLRGGPRCVKTVDDSHDDMGEMRKKGSGDSYKTSDDIQSEWSKKWKEPLQKACKGYERFLPSAAAIAWRNND